MHLSQQIRQRVEMEKQIARAREVDPITGQPISFFMLGDAMTESKGETPKMNHFEHQIQPDKDGAAKIGNRVYGIDVFCGKIDNRFPVITIHSFSITPKPIVVLFVLKHIP